jgi:16S rRNA processing protein RimM
MEHDGFYLLGSIYRTHGVKGNVIVRIDVDQPAAYKKLQAAFLDLNGKLQEFKVTSTSILNDQLILHLEGIEDMDEAEKLIRVNIFLPMTELPKLKGKKIYLHEAVGMTVMDATEGELGIIEKIYDLPEQPMASVPIGGKELLFPLIAAFIERVDRVNKVLYVNLPEGLVAIYR